MKNNNVGYKINKIFRIIKKQLSALYKDKKTYTYSNVENFSFLITITNENIRSRIITLILYEGQPVVEIISEDHSFKSAVEKTKYQLDAISNIAKTIVKTYIKSNTLEPVPAV